MLSQDALNNLVAQLVIDEGYRSLAYDDASGDTVKAPRGNLTIGIGWNIANGIPKPLAEMVCKYFISECDEALTRSLHFYLSLDQVRKAVLCNMAFNMGVSKLMDFKQTLKAIETKDYRLASLAMLQSQWAQQVGQRAVRLSKMMNTGQWI